MGKMKTQTFSKNTETDFTERETNRNIGTKVGALNQHWEAGGPNLKNKANRILKFSLLV